MQTRLQKLMARAGLGSRRHNEKLIAAGRVLVNGRVARLGDRADPATDRIEVDGRPLTLEKPIYIKLNKPRGVLSSTEDELGQGRMTVRELVPIPGHLYPVGRLDKQSEGLVLLTNDGLLTNRLTHPRYGHKKVYRVSIEGSPTTSVLDQWRRGVELDGRKSAPAEIEVLEVKNESTWLRITMQEGRKRQIRRIAALLGYPVKRLIREQIGPIRLDELKPGQWQYLEGHELTALKWAAFRTSGKKRS